MGRCNVEPLSSFWLSSLSFPSVAVLEEDEELHSHEPGYSGIPGEPYSLLNKRAQSFGSLALFS